MTQKDTGGPAFAHGGNELDVTQTGMTLRDYFAGQALAGIMADPTEQASMETFAGACYEMADAMIAARKETT